MRTDESIYEANEFAISLAIFALIVIASERGFRLGRKSRKQAISDAKSQHLTVEAGILGVLGLMLGFTMAMALSRFELRKQLVLQRRRRLDRPICLLSCWKAKRLVPSCALTGVRIR